MDAPVPFHDLDRPGEKRFEFPAGDHLDFVDLATILEIGTKEMIPIIVQCTIRNRARRIPGDSACPPSALTLLL
jgi:hypothetical protein